MADQVRFIQVHFLEPSFIQCQKIRYIPKKNDIYISKPQFNLLQQERAFQKQPTVFQNQKRLPGVKKAALKRYTRTVGLGFKMPSEVRCRVWILTNEFSVAKLFLTDFLSLLQKRITNICCFTHDKPAAYSQCGNFSIFYH